MSPSEILDAQKYIINVELQEEKEKNDNYESDDDSDQSENKFQEHLEEGNKNKENCLYTEKKIIILLLLNLI